MLLTFRIFLLSFLLLQRIIPPFLRWAAQVLSRMLAHPNAGGHGSSQAALPECCNC